MTHTILLIDDDADILKVLTANLNFHGFRVIAAESWKEGCKAFASCQPDLLLLDVMLPDGDGFDICRVFRKEYPLLPIIMLTAKDKISDKVMCFDGGADDYVVKPFETLELIARIKACLRRSKSANEEVTVVGNLSVDYKRRSVKIKEKEVALTPKEYQHFQLLLFEHRYSRVLTHVYQQVRESIHQ